MEILCGRCNTQNGVPLHETKNAVIMMHLFAYLVQFYFVISIAFSAVAFYRWVSGSLVRDRTTRFCLTCSNHNIAVTPSAQTTFILMIRRRIRFGTLWLHGWAEFFVAFVFRFSLLWLYCGFELAIGCWIISVRMLIYYFLQFSILY